MAILKRLALLLSLCSSFTFGEMVGADKFGLLNTNEAPVIIDNSQAQDLLNVDVTPNGRSVKKRSGYGLYKTLSGSQGIHGGHHFYNSTGDDVQVWGSSTSLWGIVADGTATQLVSSATLNTTWDCADSQGFAYCVTSNRDALIRTTGAAIVWSTSTVGTMVAVTPERLLMAGVNAAPSTLYYSASNNLLNFTVGNNVSDASTELIAAPGSKLTHIEYACQRWLWWKDQSFGYILGTDQTNLQVVTVSNSIGSLDNSSAIDPDGNVYFRAQDGHIYRYNCSSLEKLSLDITPVVQTSGRRTSNSWTQTTQSDFEVGLSSPTVSLSFTASSGEVVLTSYTATDTSATDFSSGTFVNTYVSNNSVKLSTNNSGTVPEPGFESSGANWTSGGAGAFSVVGSLGAGFYCSGPSPRTGSGQAATSFSGALGATSVAIKGQILLASDNSTLSETNVALPSAVCSYTQATVTAPAASAGKRVKFRLVLTYNGGTTWSTYTTNSSFILGGDITFYYRIDSAGSGYPSTGITAVVDDIAGGSSTITTGSFTSRVFDTGYAYSVIRATAGWTVDDSTPIFAMLTSSATNGVWSSILTSTSTDANAKRYVVYVASFTVGSGDANTTFDDAFLLARSTGTYYSAVKNAPNLTAWDSFQATKLDNGGSHTFYVRSATNSFSVLSTTPSWVAQSIANTVAASPGTYFQVRDDFGITSSTQTPTLSDFTVNWFEGTSSDKAYAAYFQEAIWWSVAYGAGVTTNNYILKYDLLNDGWTLYNFGAGGFLLQNSALYFGTTASTGKLYRFGNATSDDGTAINAYWQSKDFSGADPWLENEYLNIDTIARRNQNETLTVSYALNSSTTTTSYSISLSSTTDSTIRHKKLLPSGKIGGLLSLKFSDTSTTSAWEVLGFRVNLNALPYRSSR